MSTTTTPPVISFQNSLAYDIVVYDSFDDEPQTDDSSQTDADSNYLGTLTRLGNVTANSTGNIQPIHSTSTFIVENATSSKPVKRCIKLGSKKTLLSFSVVQQDEDNMTKTFQFIDFILANPKDPVATSFNALWQATDSDLASGVDDFFSKQPGYSNCTFEDYMMGITYHAKNPDNIPKPVQETTYSLSQLISLMGGSWPSEMPDIIVSQFKCAFKNNALSITMQIDISQLPFETPDISKNVNSLFGDKKLTAELTISFQLGLGIFGTRLTIDIADYIKVPTGNGNSFAINKPTITFDINPLFKFVVFTLRGYIPFNIFGSKFNTDISMVIDNVEAEIGVVIEGDNSSLPAPPIMKGVHFDQFGIGMGVFFEPPGFALGLQGKLHIGTPNGQNVIDLNDDTFVLVCKIDGEVPEPVYASFYVPQMDINKVVEIFTNASPNLDIPVTFTDLSFKWAENPMDPVILPDGTLSEMAYGFSAAINVFSFGFYGDVEIDMNNGLTANVQMSPLSWRDVFQMSGDGPGVTIKVDQNGNPIRNNEIRDKQVLKDALAKATDKQLIAPGGPVLQINTFTSPILHMNGKVSLFELVNASIEADINKDGILFELDYGAILMTRMSCRLADFHNLFGSFTYYINKSITLPTIAGVRLGYIPVAANVNVHLSVVTTLQDIVLGFGGSFDFDGLTRSFGDFTADIHIKKITDFLEAIGESIVEHAEEIFSDLLGTAEAWAGKAKQGVIWVIDAAGPVLKNAYNKTAQEVTSIMKGAGYIADEIVTGLKDAFHAEATDVAALMKAAGFAADQIAAGIQKAWQCGLNDVTYALHYAGYTAKEVAGAVKKAFNTTKQDITNSLKWLGYAANDVVSSLKNVYGSEATEVAALMKAAGFAADQIATGIQSAWGCGLNDVTYALHYAGYTADEIGGAVKTAFGTSEQDIANSLKWLGYSANEVAGCLKNVYGATADAASTVMKQAGYAVNDIASAFDSLGGDFKSFADDVKNSKVNPSNW